MTLYVMPVRLLTESDLVKDIKHLSPDPTGKYCWIAEMTREPLESSVQWEDVRHTAICVATFRRPAWLRRTLLSLHNQDLRGVAIELTIVVVDNDELGSAAPVVEEVKAQARWPITYILEPRPGIPYARNAAVRAARSADLIAFIDDDEEAGTDWLRELIEFQMSTGAQVVAGPVIPEFEIEPPSWILKGRFFERPRHASGSRMQTAATGNLLITRELLEDIGERPFEEKMALTGGTDTLLSMRIHRAGHAILWCDEAIVKEWNPPTRMSARWLIKRAYRGGTSYALSESVVYGSGARRLARIGKGIARAAQGVLQAVLGAMTFRSDRVLAGARTGALGMGMIMGAVGKRYEAYKRGRE